MINVLPQYQHLKPGDAQQLGIAVPRASQLRRAMYTYLMEPGSLTRGNP